MSISTKSFLRLSNATGIRRFGEHLTWVQEPDIFHMRLVGTLDAPEYKKILDWQAEWGKNKSLFFVVSDVSALKSISRDAHKCATEQGRIAPAHAATITYGATFAIRVMAEMSMRARKILGTRDLVDTVFVDNQAEALIQIEKRRNNGS